jgi:hypothetical protein
MMMLNITDDDPPALSLPTREYDQPSWIQALGYCVRNCTKKGMSLSGIISLTLRAEGHSTIYLGENLGAKFFQWDNFPWFFPKTNSPIYIISKNDSQKLHRIK